MIVSITDELIDREIRRENERIHQAIERGGLPTEAEIDAPAFSASTSFCRSSARAPAKSFSAFLARAAARSSRRKAASNSAIPPAIRGRQRASYVPVTDS